MFSLESEKEGIELEGWKDREDTGGDKGNQDQNTLHEMNLFFNNNNKKVNIQKQKRHNLIVLPTGQLKKGNASVEFPSSQVTLFVCQVDKHLLAQCTIHFIQIPSIFSRLFIK